MANTGIVTNTNEPLYSEQTIDVHAPGTATPFALNPGTIIGVDGALAGRALRAAILTGSVTATGTQQAFAHGLVNEEGNPTAPTFPAILAQDGVLVFSERADQTNVYLTSPSTANNAFTLLLVY